MKLVRLLPALIALATPWLHAEPIEIPDQETAQPPTTARIAAIVTAARHDGWAAQVAPLRTAAIRAYARDNLYAAEAWYDLCAWASLLGETEAQFVPHWIDAVNSAQLGHANMPRDYPTGDVPLGNRLSPDLQTWLIGNRTFSEEFFALLSPVDYLSGVFDALDAIYRADPIKFRAYPDLALAIAVVYDVPPPPNWPHGQVSAAALPRKLMAPAEAFAWWEQQDRLGHLYQPLKRLPAEQLKFVVDTAAPRSELEWAREKVAVPLAELDRTYGMVRYRAERFATKQVLWPGRTYRLADILTTGGICADQTYFATTVAKARGVPSLFFAGAGNDARHAWFGYLDANQRWRLDVGRYEEEGFVTGFAIDPQTWAPISDHELEFLTQGFRRLPSYRQSRVHEEFASLLLPLGNAKAATVAARKAVNYEPRNQAAWDVLIAATRKDSTDPKPTEVVIREAALAFQHYPDLEALYVSRLCESLRARGQTSEADAEIRRIARKNQGQREDITISQAHALVQRAISTQPLRDQIRTYESVVDAFGSGAGMAFFDQVVRPFVDYLRKSGHVPEALRAIERARSVSNIPPHSQLEYEFAELEKHVRAGK